MLFKNISYIDENFQIKCGAYIGILNDVIDYIGDTAPCNAEKYGREISGANKLLIPGFVNAHAHSSMNLLRGYAENLALSDWLNGSIFPFEAKLTHDDMYFGSLMNIAEMLRFGITSATDMYLNLDATIKAFSDAHMKGNLSVCVMCFDDSELCDIQAYKQTINAVNTIGKNQLIRPEFSLHAEYTSNEKIACALAKSAKDASSSIHVHVSETAFEVSECRKRHGGKSPVEYLADCGLFDVPTTAAHCVHIDQNDIAILKEKNVTVATCPKSNLKLASGICPVSELVQSGVNVALGTDSVASNNNINMLEEMKFLSLLAKKDDPTKMTPSETLYAATRAGALSQNRSDCGLIKKGFKADITVIDTDKIYMQPTHNLLNNLVFSSCGTDVCMTIVNGDILFENGEYNYLDIEKIKFEHEKRRKRILSEL